MMKSSVARVTSSSSQLRIYQRLDMQRPQRLLQAQKVQAMASIRKPTDSLNWIVQAVTGLITSDARIF